MKENKDSQKIVYAGVIFFAMFVILVFICIFVLFSGLESDAKPVGLKNHEQLDAPPAITAEDLEEEYQSRPEITPEMQGTIDQTVLKLSSLGSFSELDKYLAEQESAYKNAEGDESQGVEDWLSKSAMLRADIATTVSLNERNAAISWISYTSPEILAAAIAYSPISLKVDAFMDYSSAMFPAVSPEDASAVNLRPAEIEDPAGMLAEINNGSSEKFYGLSAYDMTLFGYRCRFYAIGDEAGYYRPYSLVGIDGHLVEPVTKQTVLDIQRALDPYTSLDDVISVSPFNREEYDAMMDQHPDWFDENGTFIVDRDAVKDGAPTPATPTAPVETPIEAPATP